MYIGQVHRTGALLTNKPSVHMTDIKESDNLRNKKKTISGTGQRKYLKLWFINSECDALAYFDMAKYCFCEGITNS